MRHYCSMQAHSWGLNGIASVAGFVLALAVLSGRCEAAPRPVAKPLYQASFETNALDRTPEDFLVLDGGFAVKEEGGNKFLELPGAPLDTFGVLFGPTEGTGLAITARIRGSAKGRRFPTFAVGLNGVGGYKLQVSPAKKLLELYRGDEVLASAPFAWASETWTTLRLQTRKGEDGQVQVQGKAWKQGEPEPKKWQISRAESSEAPPGRPSVWGMPYAGTPID